MKNLLVLCGGQSPEHRISIRSAKNILNALDHTKYDVTIIGISRKGSWRLIRSEDLSDEIKNQGEEVIINPGSEECFSCNGKTLGRFDVVFPILHGPNGEDGTIQGLLKLLEIPFVGPDVLGSAISMDKDVTKRLLVEAGIKVADWILIRSGEDIPDFIDVSNQLGVVVFVKPANMGSSVGVHRVSSQAEWEFAVRDALTYDRRVLIEKSIEGRELECAVLGNEKPKASGVGEVRSGNFYSYEEKYDASSEAQIDIPANIDPQYLSKLQEVALRAYKALDCQGLSRVDMFLTNSGEVLVNEVNTMPGFTSISMYPKLWEEAGLSYADLLDELIEYAAEKSV